MSCRVIVQASSLKNKDSFMKNIDTLCIHSGYEPQSGEPKVLPIAQSTVFEYEDVDKLARLFDLEDEGHMYSRISNPTVAAFEKKMASLEGGVGAVATSAGQSATLNAILTICNAGEHVLSMQNLYGGTYTLFSSTLKKMGIDVSFVDPNAPGSAIAAAIQNNTKLIFGETIGNPGLDVLDIERVANVAHKNGLPLMLDNTFPTPYLCRPFQFGADIVIHSTTKYLDGHATSIGGVIIDSGNFDWEKSGRHPHLTDPDPSYHGLSYTKKFGRAAFAIKARVVFVRDIGNIMAPFNAFLTNLGTETLALRMERHSFNALKTAEYLENHSKISWVNYPGLKSSRSYALSQKYLPRGASGVISFGVEGGVEAGKKFINSLKLVSLLVHVGDVRSMVLHPASMTHRQLSPEQQLAAGVRPDMVRLSVGIENVDDIIEDLDQALIA